MVGKKAIIPATDCEPAVSFSPQHNAWIIRGLAEARAILLSRRFSSNAYAKFGSDIGQGNNMLMASGVRHKLLKHLFSRYISSRVGIFQRTSLRPIARQLLPRVVPQDTKLLLSGYVYPYYRESVYRIIGLKRDQGDEIVACMRVARAMSEQQGSNSADAQAAHQILAERVKEIYQQTSGHGRGVISDIITDSSNPNIIDAIHLTLPLLRTLALDLEGDLTWRLLRVLLDLEPDRRQRVLRCHGGLFRACQEILRLEADRFIPRTARDDTPLGAHLIRRGALVLVMLGAIGKNPKTFDKPHEFHEDRTNLDDYPGFGLGDHRCVGEVLAKTIASTAAEVLFETRAHTSIDG